MSSRPEPTGPSTPTYPNPPTAHELHESLRAIGPGRLEVTSSLLSRGADINSLYEYPPRGPLKGSAALIERNRTTPLFGATRRGDLEAVQFLIDNGADVHKRNLTFVGIRPSLFSASRARETLSALDGMRTSPDLRITELSEHLFGIETEEERERRKKAFDDLPRWPPVRSTTDGLTDEKGMERYGKKKWERIKKAKEAQVRKSEENERWRMKELEKLREARRARERGGLVEDGDAGAVENDDRGAKKRKVDTGEGEGEKKVYNLRPRT